MKEFFGSAANLITLHKPDGSGPGAHYAEVVLITGEIIRVGGKSAETSGYDLMGIITGSEGLLGVITEVTVRILQKPETARALMVGFAKVEAATFAGAVR